MTDIIGEHPERCQCVDCQKQYPRTTGVCTNCLRAFDDHSWIIDGAALSKPKCPA